MHKENVIVRMPSRGVVPDGSRQGSCSSISRGAPRLIEALDYDQLDYSSLPTGYSWSTYSHGLGP